ncbi:hypothetical protein MIND_00414200 [Mycena indigotica]|uniref:DUF6534 domain-containing protein n=1 Tax=Mycena indigotica TaxID=2126181 RepID=A0A8H6SX09_9AGAR|nr:uncharacterized protein MIND_00414200 [Mycena indigotica]KAF7306236.1 hypothetical protein MIND_00414200 [Mycena indigotica]
MTTPAFDAGPTLGALLIGTLISCILWGIGAVQVYGYYSRFPEDRLAIKATVAFVCLCETAHITCVMHTLYSWLVTDYGHPERLMERPPPSVLGFIFLTVVIAVYVQLFFSYRIYVLSSSLVIPSLATLLSVARFALGMTIFGVGFRIASLSEYVAKWDKLALAIWSLSAAEDVLITATLVFLLWRQRAQDSTTGQTAILLDKIIMWTIETGLLTSTFSLAMLVCFHLMSNNFVWIAMFTIEARLFANSLFASLNSRTVLRQARSGNLSGSGEPLSTFDADAPFTVSHATASGGSIELDSVQRGKGDSA